jgi:hypothetical protein
MERRSGGGAGRGDVPVGAAEQRKEGARGGRRSANRWGRRASDTKKKKKEAGD